MLRKLLITGVAIAVVALTASSTATPVVPPPSTVLPATVVPIDRPVANATFKTVNYVNGQPSTPATTTWRVVQGTGNCCENYLVSTRGGRLLDFGGAYVNYSDDRGKTWNQVHALAPFVNGEGAIAVAPNGDVVGVQWDPYSGDRLVSFKYDANSRSWFYAELQLHTPFYDRQWVTTVPGPLTINGQTYPYVTLLKGGYPTKELYFLSLDGLEYNEVTSKFVETLAGSGTETVLKTTGSAVFDFTQPNTNGLWTPLGGGRLLAQAEDFGGWATLDSSLTWHTFHYAGGQDPSGLFQVDAAGRVHNVVLAGDRKSFQYRVSKDGGRTWSSTSAALPAGYSIDQIDFRAARFANAAAVVIHAARDADGVDQDLVYRFAIAPRPTLQRLYYVGKGDQASVAGVGNSIRMDFQTVTFMPDGKLAVSFLDTTTHYPSPTTGAMQARPALAVELG
jgi:hypothetical protein